jgi:hypothetical protein
MYTWPLILWDWYRHFKKWEDEATVHGEVYSIEHYVIKFVSDGGSNPVSSTNKTDRHDITNIIILYYRNQIRNN